MSKRLADQAALLTGAGTGIGRAIAQALAQEGARVWVTDLDLNSAKKVADGIVGAAGRAEFARLDVTDRAQAGDVLARLVAAEGRLDLLVNNAGVSTMARVVDLTDAEWDQNMAVNAKGVFILSQLAVRQMLHQASRGTIVTVASMAGKIGPPFLAHYSASKFAVIGFTQALAKEVAGEGIRVNAVCPGYVRTSMQEREVQWESKLRGILPEEVRALYLRDIPLGRLEEPEDVARVVVFLASQDAGYMTGQAINVTGGACMH